METAVVTPPTAALPKPLMQDSIEKIVQGILEKQQQQHRPEQKRRQTKTSLACGQPKSRYGTDGSSIHFFYQQGPVRYFYCSRKLNMQKQVAFFPGKLQVVFRKGPLGFLLQEPSDEAKRVSSTPQDKSVATREDLVRQNALAVIPQRGGGGVPQIRWRFWETVCPAVWLQQYLLKRQQPTTSSTPAEHPMKAPAEPLVQQEHATGLDLFMDLIKNMLQVDPNQRITPVEALQHPFFNVKEEAASKEPCLENIQLTNYAVDQLEKPELVPPETVVSQENPAEVQPDNSGEDQLNDGFQTGDNTLNYTCFVNTLRTVGHALALPKRTEKFDWFGWF
ncbi:hypothetical protein D4764_0226090 [Takifugu flavidus]|uniref:Uncharacterized protein n=1 Tax=Takifugu flavidus TaxID=433684 RepID=A0A5C6MF16_9TELE|nr:hypothetical protein D4764_0226090 [Takifugu flavidus]